MAGIAKIKEVLPVYYDWMFFQDFLTPDTIDKLDMYIYLENEYPDGTIEYVKADYPLDEIKQIIINSFINTGIPKIEIVDGNLDGSQKLLLNHKYVGSSLDRQYTEETLKHIYNMWGRDIFIKTVYNDKEVLVSLKSTTRK
jgi:stage V sporulation protein R